MTLRGFHIVFVTFCALLFGFLTAWAFLIGALPIAITLIGWFWPKAPGHDIPGAADEPAGRVQEARA